MGIKTILYEGMSFRTCFEVYILNYEQQHSMNHHSLMLLLSLAKMVNRVEVDTLHHQQLKLDSKDREAWPVPLDQTLKI